MYTPFKMNGPSMYSPMKKDKKSKETTKTKTKEDYLSEGFTPSGADRMMKEGAVTGKSKKLVAKKSTVAVDGQLSDAEYEFQQDKKLIAKMNKKKKK